MSIKTGKIFQNNENLCFFKINKIFGEKKESL